MRNWLSVFIFVTVFASCSKSTTDAIPGSEVAIEMKNVAYATASLQQNMDVYLPAGRSQTSTNCIIVIHGGSWNAGDKADMDPALTAIKPLLPTYATFNLNYRLAESNLTRHPAQLDDINTAIDFIISKAKDYKVNVDKMIIVGASAGAHLGLLKAYKNNADGRVKAMVDYFGPTDLTWMYHNHPYLSLTQNILVNYLGVTEPSDPALYRTTSPINYVTGTVPPTIIFQGTADPIVPISESNNLNAKLQASGVTHQYITYQGGGHGDWDNTTWTDSYNKVASFIKTYVP